MSERCSVRPPRILLLGALSDSVRVTLGDSVGVKLWTGWWKSACSGGQHGPWLWIRCGRLNNFENTAAAPCADPRGGSRNTSLPETGTTPGATPGTQEEPGNRTFRREPGTSSRSMNASQPGNQRASGQRPGKAPASHTCGGLAIFASGGPCHFRAEAFPGGGLAISACGALPFPGGVIGQPSRLSRSARCGSRTGRRVLLRDPPGGRIPGRREFCLAGAGRQSKEMDAINPESARTDVTLAFRAPAGRGTAADRERGAC